MKYVFIFLFLVMGPVPLVTGVLLTVSQWSDYRERMALYGDWVETEAEVIFCSQYNPYHRDSNTWPYWYRMQWTDAAGQVHQGKSSENSCTVGRRYMLRYDPEHPEQMYEGRERYVPTPLILCVLGLGFTGIGVKEWWKYRRAESAAPPQ